MQENKNQEINIVVLSDLESVRKRSGMYLGDTSTASICARECIDNCVDECFQSDADTIYFKTYDDGVRLVADNGRGLPIIMDERGITKAELTMTKLHSGSKFDKDESNIGTGMNGVGVTAVNFTSNYYIILSKITSSNYDKSIPEVKSVWESSKDKKDLYYTLEFKKGNKVFEGAGKKNRILGKLTEKFQIGFDFPDGMSTIVIFQPDDEIFESIESSYPLSNLKYTAAVLRKFYNKELKFYQNDELITTIYEPKKFEFMTEVKRPKGDGTNYSAKFYVTFEVSSDLSLTDYSGCVNSLKVPMGLHMNAARDAYSKALKSLYNIQHENLRNGLCMDVICIAPEVQFSSQTKQNLTKVECFNITDLVKSLEPEFRKIIKNNPEVFDLHVERLNTYAESLSKISAIQKVKNLISTTSGNSNKIRSKIRGVRDAAGNKRNNCTLYICEGKSAASNIINVRDPQRDAIFELRGIVKNAVGIDLEELMANEEAKNLINCLACGVNAYHDKSKLRYGKIVIVCDSDADGRGKISSGVLGIIAAQMTFLFDMGVVYIADTPLYKQNGKYYYPDDLSGLDLSKPADRFKGIGSLTEEDTRECITGPNARLIQITSENYKYAMELLSNSNSRKELMIKSGIITDPYHTGIL